MTMKEIRWHGRGGQGAKTAAGLVADWTLRVGEALLIFDRQIGPHLHQNPGEGADPDFLRKAEIVTG